VSNDDDIEFTNEELIDFAKYMMREIEAENEKIR
jgi:hypothetical protein